jgi:hypothetical protein
MKKYSILLLLLPLLCSGQEETQKDFEFNFISLNPLSVYRTGQTGGFCIGGDVSFMYKENTFLISAQFGAELGILSDYSDSFSGVSLLWGKEFELNYWLQSDVFVGLSYFYYKTGNVAIRGYDRTTTVGIPITSKLKFMIGDHFSFGPQLRLNINSVQTVVSLGVAFQVDF